MKNSVTNEQVDMLYKAMELYEPIPYPDFEKIIPILKRIKFTRGEVLFSDGAINRSVYFLIKGCVRNYSLEDGKEVNLKFYFEKDIFADFNSLKNETSSTFYFVALESCEALFVAKKDLLPLILQSRGLMKFSFRFFENLFIEEESHSNSFKLLTPEQRYNYLKENRPYYLQRIPLTYLASYLGTSRETLNRIRRNQ